MEDRVELGRKGEEGWVVLAREGGRDRVSDIKV